MSVQDQQIENSLPSWLTGGSDTSEVERETLVNDLDPNDPARRQLIEQGKQAKRFLENTLFENIFDDVIDGLSSGQPVTAILEKDARCPNYPRFISWIYRDEVRKNRYYEAQAIGAEMVASEMIRIADADDSLEDVARSTLKINTRKWILGVWNRKRFGDVKQVEQTVTVDIGEAMAAAQARVMASRGHVIDITPRTISE